MRGEEARVKAWERTAESEGRRARVGERQRKGRGRMGEEKPR